MIDSCGGELVLTYAAGGANPVFGEVCKCGAGSDAVVRIANCGVILITADVTYVLFHVVLVIKR